MKHLLIGAAVGAALAVFVPVWAQPTTSTGTDAAHQQLRPGIRAP